MTIRAAITGVGLSTALGQTAGSCAALRAGTSAPRRLPFEISLGDGESEAAVGYPNELADGFSQIGAWVRLASLSLDDLQHHAALELADPPLLARGALAIALPAVSRDRFGWDLSREPRGLHDEVALPVADLAGVPALGSTALLATDGHPSAFGAWSALLASADGPERILSVAADSYVDEPTVSWLSAEGRLKGPDRPTGLMPGEAGAALLLETDRAARQRAASVLGWVEAVSIARPRPGRARAAPRGEDAEDARWLPPAAPGLGRTIADVVRRVLPPAPDGAPWRGDLYLDLNGEYWRADAWGHAAVHLRSQVDLDACRLSLPADSLGETGAAGACVAVALALWNFDRDRTREALVVCVGDDGAVGAVRLSSPRRPSRP